MTKSVVSSHLTNKPSKKQSAKIQRLFQLALSAHQNKQWTQAEQHYQQVIDLEPSYAPAYINLGSIYRHKQQADKAQHCYEQAVAYDPKRLEAWFNLGNLLMEKPGRNGAAHAFQQILNHDPSHCASLSQLATLARLQGDWRQAIFELERWLKIQPDAVNAHLELGNACRHLGQNSAALEHYQQAVHFAPESWKTHYSLARLADQLGDISTYTQHYEMALKLTEEPYSIHLALAQTRLDNANHSGAAEQYHLALALQPDSFEGQLGLAAVLMSQGEVSVAKSIIERLSQLVDVHALSRLAKVIWDYKLFAEAIAILEKMVRLRPELYDTHLNLAKAYSQNWQFSKALLCITRSLSIKPDCDEANDLLADIYLRQGQCDKSITLYEQRLAREGFNASNAASLLFTLLYSRQHSVAYKAQRHRDLMEKIIPHSSSAPVFTNPKQSERPLKIGYISADFRDEHPVGLFLSPVLLNHNHKQFNIHCYYNSRTNDQSTNAIRNQTNHWREVSGWTDARLQQQVIADGIDILVDLSGQTAKNRLGVFALRAAPVQVTWLGYPHSTGLTNIDYLIADAICCPPENDSLCSEQIYRLPDRCVFCYPANDQYPAFDSTTRKTDRIVFGSFNNLTKVNEVTLQLWIKLLHAIPQADLYLKTPSFTDPNCIEQFYADFALQGIARERLYFKGPSGLDDMMREYLQIDIGLDPIPYNGGTTTLQALWMGVPVLTLAGENFCGRMGASIMHHAGLSDWIAETEDDYIRIAQQKASQPTQLMSLKKALRESLRYTPLFDNKGFTHTLETAYRTLWESYCLK